MMKLTLIFFNNKGLFFYVFNGELIGWQFFFKLIIIVFDCSLFKN